MAAVRRLGGDSRDVATGFGIKRNRCLNEDLVAADLNEDLVAAERRERR